ncbi:hypothetical protein BKA80DRAFT_311755 [Phyllosticta citrichinensis]
MTTYPNFSLKSLPRPPPPSHMPARQPQQQPTDNPYALSTTDDVGLLSEESQRPSTGPNRTLSGAAPTNAANSVAADRPSNPFLDPPSGTVSRPIQTNYSRPTGANNPTPTQASNPGPTQANNPTSNPPSTFSRGLRATRRFLSYRWPSLAIGACFAISLGVAVVWFWYLARLDAEAKKKWNSRPEGSVGDGDGR